MSETISDIIREMRSVGDYPMYRKPVFSSPKFVSTSYVKHFKKCPEGLYFGETVFVEDPRVVEVHVYELAARIEKAHKREIAAKDVEIARLRALVKGLLEASSISCADCKYDCYSDHRNCIIHEAAKYIDESEVENG